MSKQEADRSDGSQRCQPAPSAEPQRAAQHPAPKVPVVAIGASAGGLEALQAFFSKIPADSGIAFLVVTHTKPDRESLLPELLGNVAAIPCIGSEDGTRLAANQVVIARDALLGLSGGALHHLTTDDEPEASHHPIDHLFRALAEDQKEHAIGVVLSGSGNDGTLGLKAIKAVGGMVMVQDSATAKYPGMPDSAQATGLADYVLPADALPAALLEYCRGPFLRLAGRGGALTLPEDAIHAILVRLRTHSGHDFTCYKKSTMSRRIERRMNVHRMDDPQTYLAYLRENPRELDVLLQELLISVTRFFRDPEAWSALADSAVPQLLDGRQDGHTIRVWVPGCATGEEAYSTAILLHEQIRKAERLHEVQLFATDLDPQAIDVARSGLYPEGIAADVSEQRLRQYFTKEDGAYRIHKNIRDMIVFAVQNVVSDPPFIRTDLIVCRNLLIYLSAEAQQRILPTFHYALRPGGLLFLGSSETIGETGRFFEAVDGRHKIFRRKETTPATHPLLTVPYHPQPKDARSGEHADVPAGGQPHLARLVERLLLERFVPCSALVDDRDVVVYLHGRSGLYLEPEQGAPRNNILQMAREGLRPALSRALRQARRKGAEVVQRNVRVQTNGEAVRVDVTARPMAAPQSLRGLILVTLQAARGAAEEDAGAESPPLATGEREELERELQYTRENLQTTIEELETSNEELKSSNEELQSTNEELHSSNEELETSKEEMQSLNEELNTVNAELQSKVDALSRANDDMNNLLNSMQVATIFLDGELRVKRYTDQATDVIRLIHSDIGRPLSDLTSSLRYDGLIGDCRKVLATLVPVQREVEDGRGCWYMIRLMPYRTAENVIDGLVMTIVDIDRTKQAEQTAQAGSTFFESIFQTVREPMMVLDGELRVIQANDSFYHTFLTQPKKVEGVLVYELGDRQWDIPQLRRLLEEVLPENTVMNDFRVEHDFPRIGRRAFLLNARRLSQPEEKKDLILLAFEEVPEAPR